MRADELRAYNNLDDLGRQAYDALRGWRRPGLLLLAIGRTMRKGGHISAHMAAAKSALAGSPKGPRP